MKKRLSIVSLFLLTACLWLAASEVQNGLVPEGKAKTITWNEELVIAADGSADHLKWSGTRVMVQVNDQGHMFVLDQNGFRILEFAADGAFVRQIGKRGMEDADFSRPQNFNILADQSAILAEYRQGKPHFVYFDKDMNFVKRHPYLKAGLVLRSVVFAPNGKMFQGFYNAGTEDPDKMIMRGVIMDPELKTLHEVFGFTNMAWKMDKIGDGEWWVDYMGDAFRNIPANQGLAAFDSESRVYTAINGTYKITRWSADLKEELVFGKKYEPIPMTKEDVDRMISPIHHQMLSSLKPDTRAKITPDHIRRAVVKANWPDTMAPLYALIPLADGHLLTVSKYDTATHAAEGDLFDGNGKLLGSVTLPPVVINVIASYYGYGARMIVRGDKAYAIIRKDKGIALARYNIEIH